MIRAQETRPTSRCRSFRADARAAAAVISAGVRVCLSWVGLPVCGRRSPRSPWPPRLGLLHTHPLVWFRPHTAARGSSHTPFPSSPLPPGSRCRETSPCLIACLAPVRMQQRWPAPAVPPSPVFQAPGTAPGIIPSGDSSIFFRLQHTAVSSRAGRIPASESRSPVGIAERLKVCCSLPWRAGRFGLQRGRLPSLRLTTRDCTFRFAVPPGGWKPLA